MKTKQPKITVVQMLYKFPKVNEGSYGLTNDQLTYMTDLVETVLNAKNQLDYENFDIKCFIKVVENGYSIKLQGSREKVKKASLSVIDSVGFVPNYVSKGADIVNDLEKNILNPKYRSSDNHNLEEIIKKR